MAKLKPSQKQILEAALEKSFDPKVSSRGYSDAQIMLLSGYPLKEDLLQGLALASSENQIRQFLTEHGVDINRTYRSIYIRQKLEYSGTNTKRLKAALLKIDTKQYDDILFNEIKEINPNVIVPMDDVALAAVFPHILALHKPKGRKHWIQCYRGSILPLREDWQALLPDNIRVIPTYSPQMLYAEHAARNYVTIDYARIVENSNKRSKIERPGIILIAKTYEDFRIFLKRSYEKRPTRLTFDIESYFSFPTCISLCFDGIESCTVPLLDPSVPSGELALIWQLLAKVLKDPTIEKSGQNVKYDWTILERFGFVITNVRSDTMIKGSVLYPELPRGLDFWTSIFTEIPYYKDEGKEYNPKIHTRDRLYIYCAQDSLATHQIASAMDAELEETNQKEFYETEIAPSILIYKDMDKTGFLVDDTRKKELLQKYEYLYESNQNTLRNLIGNEKFNARSPVQVGLLLYEDLKFLEVHLH